MTTPHDSESETVSGAGLMPPEGESPAVRPGGASIYDVARDADVSIVTVSRVFNDHPHVSDRMRVRVLGAARRIGYTPRLVSKRNLLAVIVGDYDFVRGGDGRGRLLLHIIRAAACRGYLVEFIPAVSLDLVTKHFANGLIDAGLSRDEAAQLINLPNVPKVTINKVIPESDWNAVCSDPEHEAAVAVEYLLAMGHARIALIVDDEKSWLGRGRREGYRQALARSGIDYFKPQTFCAATMDPLGIAQAVRDNGCTACANLSESSGHAVLSAFVNEFKLSIPDDLSVVGLESESFSPFYRPRLTTVEPPLQAIAEAAVDGLIGRLSGRVGAFSLSLKARLISRDSVRKLAGAA
jgi:LacI family transcriptional regulator